MPGGHGLAATMECVRDVRLGKWAKKSQELKEGVLDCGSLLVVGACSASAYCK
jgi:hypothetical protein